MEVTRSVILDLLPLFLANESSADTRALVSEHLERDPDLAQLVRQWQERLPEPPPAPLRPDTQALAYLEAKRQIAIKTVGLAAVIAAVIIAVAAAVTFFAYFTPPS